MLLLIVLSAIFLGSLARAQTFKVRVLGALDGKPYNDIPIIYNCDDQAQFKVTWKRTVTDSNGFAAIPYECRDDKRIKIRHLYLEWRNDLGGKGQRSAGGLNLNQSSRSCKLA